MKSLLIFILPPAIFMLLHGCKGDINDKINETSCNKTICLSIKENKVPADGSTIITLTAEIPENVEVENRMITFTTPTGVFIDGGLTTFSKMAEKGLAVALLRVGSTPGTFVIKASVSKGDINYEVKDTLFLQPVIPDNLLEIEVDKLSGGDVQADDNSLINVIIRAKFANFNGKQITVSVNNGGKFPANDHKDNISLEFDDSGSASAIMQVGQIADDYILTFKSTSPDFEQTYIQTVNPSHAEWISWETPPKPSISTSNDSLNLALRLFKSVGKVSTNTKVFFTASQLINGQEVKVGRISPSVGYSNDQEQISVKFYTEYGTPLVAGKLKFMATTINASGITVPDSLIISVL